MKQEYNRKLSINDLDKAISFLYQNQNRSFIVYHFYKDCFGIPVELPLATIILNKLDKDGYIRNDDILWIDGEKRPEAHRAYCISYEGVFFVENSPFIWKAKPYKWNKIKGIINTIWTVAKIIMIALNAVIIIYLTYLSARR